jgi:hypothetical protein
MKKLITTLLISVFVLGITYKATPQERKFGQGKEQFQGERREGPFGEAMEIRKKMKEIELQTIQNDPELMKLQEQIRTLQKQLDEKLQQKLSGNQEYQELKKKMGEMAKEWQERVKERKGENK